MCVHVLPYMDEVDLSVAMTTGYHSGVRNRIHRACISDCQTMKSPTFWHAKPWDTNLCTSTWYKAANCGTLFTWHNTNIVRLASNRGP